MKTKEANSDLWRLSVLGSFPLSFFVIMIGLLFTLCFVRFRFFCVTGSFYRIILPSDFFPAGTFYRLVMCWSVLWCLKIGNYCNAVLICRQKNCLFSLLSLTLRVFFGFVKRTLDCFPIFCINAVIGLYKYNFYCPIFISCLAASGILSFFCYSRCFSCHLFYFHN